MQGGNKTTSMKSKKLILYLSVLYFYICIAIFAYAGDHKTETYVYLGHIDNNIKIGMCLTFNDNILEGKYYYKKYLVDIPIDGFAQPDRTFVLYERDSNGNIVAEFKGYFPDSDPLKRFRGKLDREIMMGVWKKPGIRDKSFSLTINHGGTGASIYGYSPEDEEIIEKQAQRYWHAVLSDNKYVVSEYYSFPLAGIAKGGRKIKIRNKIAFISMYHKLFSSDFKNCIKDSDPKYGVSRWDGISFGCVWFSYDSGNKKLEVINPTWF